MCKLCELELPEFSQKSESRPEFSQNQGGFLRIKARIVSESRSFSQNQGQNFLIFKVVFTEARLGGSHRIKVVFRIGVNLTCSGPDSQVFSF